VNSVRHHNSLSYSVVPYFCCSVFTNLLLLAVFSRHSLQIIYRGPHAAVLYTVCLRELGG